jgi:tryptophan 2,3-dioxygenase
VERRLTYGAYLRLDDVLGAVRPLSPSDDHELWTAERFFIICHQVSELWLSQAFADIRLAARLIDRGELCAPCRLIERASSQVEMATDCLVEMWRLDVGHFLAFRPVLAGASGAQSDQFNQLLLGGKNPLIAELADSLDRAEANSVDADQAVRAHRHLDEFLGQVARWRGVHLDLVRHFIAGRPGTGGTSGASYLAERIRADDRG